MKMLTPDFSQLAELALGLQNSNVPEVSELAKGFLQLEAAYGELRQNYMRQTAELIMRRHDKLLKRLAESDRETPETGEPISDPYETIISDRKGTLYTSGDPEDEQ